MLIFSYLCLLFFVSLGVAEQQENMIDFLNKKIESHSRPNESKSKRVVAEKIGQGKNDEFLEKMKGVASKDEYEKMKNEFETLRNTSPQEMDKKYSEKIEMGKKVELKDEHKIILGRLSASIDNFLKRSIADSSYKKAKVARLATVPEKKEIELPENRNSVVSVKDKILYDRLFYPKNEELNCFEVDPLTYHNCLMGLSIKDINEISD